MSDPKRLSWYREQRDKALLAIAQIENEGRIIYDHEPSGGKSEVTVQRLLYLRQRVRVYDRLMGLWATNQSNRLSE